jgi:membrane-associated protein
VLGENAWIKEHLEWIIIGLVLITTAPVAFKMFFGKKKPALHIVKANEDVISS